MGHISIAEEFVLLVKCIWLPASKGAVEGFILLQYLSQNGMCSITAKCKGSFFCLDTCKRLRHSTRRCYTFFNFCPYLTGVFTCQGSAGFMGCFDGLLPGRCGGIDNKNTGGEKSTDANDKAKF